MNVVDRQAQTLQEARRAGLTTESLPSFEAIDRRRSQVLVVVFVVATALAAVFPLLASGSGDLLHSLPFANQPAFRAAPALLVGVLGLYVREKEKHLRRLARLLMDERELNRALGYKASRDPLTGVMNRGAIAGHVDLALHRARRRGRRVAVLFVDLNGFKQVNDIHGHDVGDLVLQEAATRVTDAVRYEDAVGRWGGDEFAVVLEGVTGDADAEAAARRVREALARPFTVNGMPLDVGASVGMAMSDDHVDDEAWLTLVRRADEGMYAEKHEHRSARPAMGTGAAR